MSENETHIKRVHDKLARLAKSYQSLQKENLNLASMVSLLKQKEVDLKLELEQMSEKVQILKAASGQMTDGDQKDFEKRINQYIKEIDHCIGMLSE